MEHSFAFLDYVFPFILTFIAGFRIWTAATSKIPVRPLTESQVRELEATRINVVTLAFFTITVITISLTFFNPEGDDFHFQIFGYGLGYLSLAMFCFFIIPYLISLNRYSRPKQNKTGRIGEQLNIRYIGETLEFVGIVALGTGLFYFVSLVVSNIIGIGVLYLLFLFALIGVAFYELYQNRTWYHPRKPQSQ